MVTKDIQTRIDQMIAAGIKLPSPPAIAVRILNTVQQEESSLRDLASIISSDPALTAKMLRIANSGFYSLKYKVTSIEKALTVLGVNILKNIALSFVIAQEMRGQTGQIFDFDYFWRRSVTSAVAAELIADLLDLKNDDTFVSALLTDIGILIMHQAMPDDYQKIFDEKKLSGDPVAVIEKRLFGMDHCEMGAGILERWELPASIYLPIRYHHNLDQAPEEIRVTAEILQIADRLSAIYHDQNSGAMVRELQDVLRERFDLTDTQVLDLVDAVANRSLEILDTFEIDSGDLRPYSQMLQEANEELGRLNLSYEQLVMELKEAKDETDRLAAELREANAKLRELVFRDGLTGLFNHRYFQEMVERELERASRYHTPLSLIMFDLDYFKKINDTYGHPNGDLVLMNIAHVVQNTVRPSDIVARYGGEEFAVILPETDETGLKIFAERLRRSVERMVTLIDRQEIQVSISVGGTCCTADGNKIDKKNFIDTADRALYASKNNGRNCSTIFRLAS